MDIFLENLVLLILITIQSIFGIGLLLFGTPTFLILGYDFINTLNFLLPISIVISSLQLISFKTQLKKIIFEYNLFCLPFLALFLIIALNFKDDLNFKIYVATILIVSSILTLKKDTFIPLRKIILKYKKFILIFIGSVHGLTNMGGSFLSVLSASTFPNNKALIRYAVAYCYFIMGIFQFLFIVFLFPIQLGYINIFYVLLSALVFSVFGEKLFASLQNYQYQKLITILIFFYVKFINCACAKINTIVSY